MRLVTTALAVMLAVVATLAIFGLPVLDSLALIYEGALGDRFGLGRTLAKATPLILTGLGMVIAWRAGMYNIGGEGQLIVGAIGGATLAHYLAASVPGPMLNPLILASASLAGALYAGIAGWLQVARGVPAVISTILLNFVAIQLLAWVVQEPLRRTTGGLPQTQPLAPDAMLLRFDRQLDVHFGLVIAVVAVLFVAIFLYGTTSGFRLRLVGASPTAARANRIPSTRVAVGSMMLSGALCGLAGAVEYTGITGTLGIGFPQGWGFLAIPVALLGALHPVGVLASGLTFGALFAGSENLARFSVGGTTLIYVIQAVAVLSVVAIHQRSRVRKPAEVAA